MLRLDFLLVWPIKVCKPFTEHPFECVFNRPLSRIHNYSNAHHCSLLMAQLTDADRYAAGYTFTDLVTECTFAGRTCTS